MKRMKLLILMGLLCIGSVYAMDKITSVPIIKQKQPITKKKSTLDDIIDAISMDDSVDESGDRSYSFGLEDDFGQINIRDGRDLAAYVYAKRKEFLQKSNSRDKKEHKKMFLQNLQQHSYSEDSPKGSESGDLVFANSELLKISSKALVDLLVHFDVLEHIQRPGGEDFYTSFQEGLDQIKIHNPGMYQDCARDIMKKMFGKHSAVVRELKSRKKSPRISEVLSSGRMMFTASSLKLLPLSSGRMALSPSIKMVPSLHDDNEDDEHDEKIDMSVPIQMMMQMLQSNKNQNQSGSVTSLVNMFHSLVEEQKNQQLGNLFSKQRNDLELLRELPHELMTDIFSRTQKVEEGNSTNWKTTIISDVVQTALVLIFTYLTGSGAIGGHGSTNSTGV